MDFVEKGAVQREVRNMMLKMCRSIISNDAETQPSGNTCGRESRLVASIQLNHRICSGI